MIARSEASAEKLFHQGRFSQIASLHFDGATKETSPRDIPYLVAALSFLGCLFEADSLLSHHRHELTDDEVALGLFALGVSHFRLQNKRQAMSAYKLLKALDPSDMQRFYLSQYVGFVRYYQGHLASANLLARRSLSFAVRCRYSFGRIFALDLLGHTQVLLGQVAEGLRHLQAAYDTAARSEAISLASAIRISILLHKGQHGHLGYGAIEILKDELQLLAADDFYTRNNLCLEIARQETLFGFWKEAESTLNQAIVSICAHSNLRQELTLDLRFAQLYLLRGEVTIALRHARNARVGAEGSRNRDLLLQALGLELKILEHTKSSKAESNNSDEVVLRQTLLAQTRQHSAYINRRILDRAGLLPKEARAPGYVSPHDDKYGHLKDLCQGPMSQLTRARVVEAGVLSFLSEPLLRFFGLAPGTCFIAKNFVSGRWLVGSSDGVRLSDVKPASLPCRLLEALAKGPQTKESLVQTLWKYTYDPERHDSILYTCVQSARKALTEIGGS